MIRLLQASALHAAMHLPRLLRSRRTLIVLLLALAPALVAWLAGRLNSSNAPGEIAIAVGWIFVLQLVVPLVGLVSGSAAIADEVEDRTLTYLFTRPMPRASLLLGRWAASALLLTAMLGLGVGLFLQAAALARGAGQPLEWGIGAPLLCATLAGGLVYSALAAALGCFVKNPIVVGLAYAFAVEGFLANLPGKNQVLTVQFHLRSLLAQHASPAWAQFEGFTGAGLLEGTTSAAVLGCLTLGALLAGAWRLSRREFVLAS
ncbi:MAG: ABC transporter permease [Planctomycetes bacterium]|nr:ABC transporter permease [Planctomycetota bacterium]